MPLHGADKVRKMYKQHRKELNYAVASVYFSGLTMIIDKTPVHFKDGGRLKNAWYLSQDYPSNNLPSSKSKSGTGSKARAEDVLSMNVLDSSIYFTNNLPYATTVEYGYFPKNPEQGTYIGGGRYHKFSSGGFSKQAPKGMVRQSLNKIRFKLRQI